MNYTDPQLAAPAVIERLAAAQRVLLLTHINPDGDAIGSQLALWHVLRGMGKQVSALVVSDIPGYCQWLPNVEQSQLYHNGDALPDVDLIILTDTASMGRIGPIYDEHAETFNRVPIVIIDHHVTNDGKGTLNLITATAASSCELLYQLLRAMEVTITPTIATCLLLGVVTDTQSFQTSATTPQSMRVAAELLEHGANNERIVQEVYYTLPASSAALLGLALGELQSDGVVAWTMITTAMHQRTLAEDDAADEVVRAMQRITGVRALALFKERADGTTKISLRSRPPINVSALAQQWGGGGHAQAAGATLECPPNEAAAQVLPRLRAIVLQAEQPAVA